MFLWVGAKGWGACGVLHGWPGDFEALEVWGFGCQRRTYSRLQRRGANTRPSLRKRSLVTCQRKGKHKRHSMCWLPQLGILLHIWVTLSAKVRIPLQRLVFVFAWFYYFLWKRHRIMSASSLHCDRDNINNIIVGASPWRHTLWGNSNLASVGCLMELFFGFMTKKGLCLWFT